jgi:hypothetical protein
MYDNRILTGSLERCFCILTYIPFSIYKKTITKNTSRITRGGG